MKKIKFFGISLMLTGAVFASFLSQAEPLAVNSECICPDVYQPVCIVATGQQFKNSCLATCAGYTSDEWVDCGDAQ